MSERSGRVATLHARRTGYWPVLGTLSLIVASEYKVRVRADDATVGGDADPFVLAEIGVYALVAMLAFLWLRPSIQLNRANWLVYLGYGYAAVVTLSALYSPYLSLAVVRAAQLVVLLALCRSIARHGGRAALHRIAHGYAVLVAGSVVFGLLVPFPRLPSQPDRFTWLYLHPVAAGQFLAIAVVLLSAYLLSSALPRPGPRWPTWVYLLLLVVCAGGLLATQTRGAVLGAAAGVLLVVWNRWQGSRRIEVAVLVSAVLIVVGLTFSETIEEFFARGESASQLATLNSRTELWSQALALVPQHPLYGFGLTASRGLFLDTIGLGGGHNAVINLLVDSGLLGLLAWLALLGGIAFAAVRIGRGARQLWTDRMIILSLLGSLTVSSIFTESLATQANVACTWLFLLWAWADTARIEAGSGRSTALGTAARASGDTMSGWSSRR